MWSLINVFAACIFMLSPYRKQCFHFWWFHFFFFPWHLEYMSNLLWFFFSPLNHRSTTDRCSTIITKILNKKRETLLKYHHMKLSHSTLDKMPRQLLLANVKNKSSVSISSLNSRASSQLQTKQTPHKLWLTRTKPGETQQCRTSANRSTTWSTMFGLATDNDPPVSVPPPAAPVPLNGPLFRLVSLGD